MNRVFQLDSLRGVATLMVFFNHIFLVLPIFTGEIQNNNLFVKILKHTPLSIIWSGHEAVIIFFILSGFVLSLAFYNKPPIYRNFIIKRVCRLYIPYVIILIFAIALNYLFYYGDINNVSSWFNSMWTPDITWKSVLAHLLFVGNFETHAFNPPIWSLVHEMRISIVFPLIMFFVLRLKWKSIFLCFGLSISGFLLSKITGSSNIDYFITIHYASMFIFGALLAMYKNLVSKWYLSLSKMIKLPLVVVICPLLISYPYWFLTDISILHVQIINDWVSALGALILISASLSSRTLITILETKFLKHMGKISYSFYLTHFVVLLTLMYTLMGTMPIWVIFSLAFIVTFSISTFLYRFVEEPSISLGRKLSKTKTVNSDQKVEAV